MPLSVTCQCGARLEIDEKFLGKEVPCPDCQRPLPTKPPAAPPPLDLPDTRRTSGLALLSLALALIGASLPPVTIAAVVVGLFATRAIARHPKKLDGAVYAWAGIGLGSFFTLVMLVALMLPTAFGIDVFLRELAMVGRVSYSGKEVFATDFTVGENVEIKRPIDAAGKPSEAWGKYNLTINQTQQKQSNDLLMLANVWEDAYITSFSVSLDGDEKIPEREEKVLKQFYKSDLVNVLGRLRNKPLNREATIVESKADENFKKELILDLPLGGLERRFLIRYTTNEINKSNVLVGAARKSRFEQMQADFRATFDKASFK